MLAWVVINRQQPRQSRKSRPIRALPLPARLFNIPTFKPSNVQTYFPLSPAFSCDYKMQISQPLCFDIHTKCPGVYESVWVLGFCSWRPQHIVKEWLATHNLWPRLVVPTQTRTLCTLALAAFADFGLPLFKVHRTVISRGNCELSLAVCETVLLVSDDSN